jgi:hypothetical protein
MPAGPAIKHGSCARTNCTVLSHMSIACLQLVQEFKLLLIRRLVFPALPSQVQLCTDMTTQVQFRAADGTTAMRTVSLMFPANCRTVVRLMEAWYDAHVSLSMLAGRHCCIPKRAGQQAVPPPSTTWRGGRVFPPPPQTHGRGGMKLMSPPLAAAVWVHSCSARYQQARTLCWPWLCHASNQPSLLLAHFTLATP